MKRPSETKNQSGNCQLSIVNCQFFLVVSIAVYLFFFFAARFEPYANLGAGLTRFSFFMYLLLPDEYFGAWLGQNGEFSLWDRLPILLTTALCLLAAISIGFITIADKCRSLVDSLSMLELLLFSTVFGLGIFSVLIFAFYFFDCGIPPLIRGFTGFVAFCFCPFLLSRIFVFFRWLREHTPVQDRRLNEETKSFSILHSPFSILWPVSGIFAVLLILGGMIPSTDYDVLSYHLAGTRTFFESGRIAFQPNDVYTSMPFGTEMFFLWGMALTGSAFNGAMVGKTIIAVTTIITALGIYTFGRRFFTETAGLIGMFLYLTTPWIFYVSTVGLVDTVVGMYAFFAVYAVFLIRDRSIRDRPLNCGLIFLAGFLAGSAAACKYPAVLFVVLPVGVYLAVLMSRGRSAAQSPDREHRPRPVSFKLAIFALAVLIACGGWYVKNWYYTGNPVYPLCYSIFGDSTGTWTPEIDDRWTRAHSPHGFGPVRFLNDFLSVGLTSPWNAPLTIPFCLILLFAPKAVKTQANRKIVWLLAGWLVFFFAVWWLLTHRIDRFWLAAVPVLSMLAGAGACLPDGKFWRRTLAVFLGVSTVYCFLACGAGAPGKGNQYLAPLEVIRHRTPWAVWFHAHPPEGKVMLIGEAKAFLYDVPVLYNSCWNETSLKEIVQSGNLAEEFRKRNIGMVLVDWSEISRFRSPGNYGYTKFVRPEIFDRLVAEGILERYAPNEELAESPTVAYRVRK